MGEDDGPQTKQHLLTGVSGDHGTPPPHDPPTTTVAVPASAAHQSAESMAANPDVNTAWRMSRRHPRSINNGVAEPQPVTRIGSGRGRVGDRGPGLWTLVLRIRAGFRHRSTHHEARDKSQVIG